MEEVFAIVNIIDTLVSRTWTITYAEWSQITGSTRANPDKYASDMACRLEWLRVLTEAEYARFAALP